MAKIYTVRANGKIFKIRGPEGATADQLRAVVQGQAPQDTPEQPGFLQRLGTGLGQASEFAEAQATKTPIVKAGLAAETGIRKAFDVGGEITAEALAGGISPRQIPGTPISILGPAQPGEAAIRTSPEVAAGLGTLVSKAPQIAETVLGGVGAIKGARAGKEALRRTFTSKGIGEKIGDAEKAAGIIKELPTTKALAQQMGLPKNTELSTILNKIETMIDGGQQLSAKVLGDARLLINKSFDLPGFRGKEIRSILARQSDKVQTALNKAIPGRGVPAAQFAKAKEREELLEKVLKGGKTALKRGALIGGAGLGAGALLKVFGGR